MKFAQITIVGTGLIGGSVGLASKSRGMAARVVGVGLAGAAGARAIERGAIDEFTTDLGSAVQSADLVVFCTPVNAIAGPMLAAAPHCRPGTLVTDAGSTKGNIVAAVAGQLPAGIDYVPAHPLAGSEKNGIDNARPDLFEKRLTILTPTGANRPESLDRVEAFWKALGSRTLRMPVDEHDRVLANTSHLPHAVAAAVAGITPAERLPVSAGGFRDVTRIASGDPALWAAIFEANREPILAAVRDFCHRLGTFERFLQSGDGAGLVQWLSEAKKVRDALGS